MIIMGYHGIYTVTNSSSKGLSEKEKKKPKTIGWSAFWHMFPWKKNSIGWSILVVYRCNRWKNPIEQDPNLAGPDGETPLGWFS